jgi:catechol 2,3-dioxygenase
MIDYGIPPPGYRLPDATTLGAVRLQVSDIERSLAYYREVLGLELLSRDGNAAALGPGGGDPLVRLEGRPGVRAAARRGLLGLYHFAILLPDRASFGRFIGHLSAIGVPAGSADHFVSEALYLSDPDGLGIEVYVDRPRSTWRHQRRQLYMTTEPLDVAGALAAGAGQPWTGMPPRTVMGHVHLHVGDIEQGAAFYHGALGFDKTVWDYPGALFMAAGGYHHHLGTNTWASGPPASDADARLLSWEIVLPEGADVQEASRSVTGAGFPVEEAGDGCGAADPWGTRVRLVTRSGPR